MNTTIHTLVLFAFDGAEHHVSVIDTFLSFANAQKALKEHGKRLLDEHDVPTDSAFRKYVTDADTTFEYQSEDDWSGFCLEIHESHIADGPNTDEEDDNDDFLDLHDMNGELRDPDELIEDFCEMTGWNPAIFNI